VKVIGRYALFDELARGGMASVHIGRLLGQGGFARTVAIKRLHPHLAKDPEFVTMLLDEARLAGRIQHANVVAMLDVVATEGELFLVMEYVHGEALSRLLRKSSQTGQRVRPAIASALMVGALDGLHAAHEVRGDRGEPLGLVHRDVTPHNIMVRRDGNALVVDFGVAKAAGRFHTTEEGKIKGKLPYMAPEQLRGGNVTRRTDIYAAGAVLWETLVGERLVGGSNEGEVLEQLLFGSVKPPSSRVAGVPAALDDVVMRALARDPKDRYATAQEMARALEAAVAPALTSQVAAWLEELVADSLEKQEAKLASIETIVADSLVSPESPLKLLTEQSAAISSSESRKQLAPIAKTPASKRSVHEAETALSDRMDALAATTRAEPPPIEPAPRSIDATPSPVGSASAVIPALRPETRPNRTPWLVAALLAVVIPIVWLVARSDRQAPTPTASNAPPGATSATIAPATSVAVPSATATATATTSATSEAIVSASAATTQPHRLPPPIRTVKTAKAPCAPFTIDPKTGRKTYNADCIP
jgi:serine/threonine protein kinase